MIQALLFSNNIYNMNNQLQDRLFQMASLCDKFGIDSKPIIINKNCRNVLEERYNATL